MLSILFGLLFASIFLFLLIFTSYNNKRDLTFIILMVTSLVSGLMIGVYLEPDLHEEVITYQLYTYPDGNYINKGEVMYSDSSGTDFYFYKIIADKTTLNLFTYRAKDTTVNVVIKLPYL